MIDEDEEITEYTKKDLEKAEKELREVEAESALQNKYQGMIKN